MTLQFTQHPKFRVLCVHRSHPLFTIAHVSSVNVTTYLLGRILIACTSSHQLRRCPSQPPDAPPVYPLAVAFLREPGRVGGSDSREADSASSSTPVVVVSPRSCLFQRPYIFLPLCRKIHSRCLRRSTPLRTGAHILTLARLHDRDFYNYYW